MPRDDRTFITVHDGIDEHPKIEALSDAAFRLLISTWAWCSRNRTDGKVRAASWTKRGAPRARKELIAAGLAVVQDDGDIQMHDYLEHQRSAAEIDELSRKRSEAGKKGGKAKASATANAKANATPVAKQNAGKSLAESETDTDNYSSTSPGSPPVPAGFAADAVRAYVEASAETPASSLQARVARQARELHDEGHPPDRIITAAANAGRAGWNDLAIQMQRDAARASPTADRPSTTDQRFRGALDLADSLERDTERRALQ